MPAFISPLDGNYISLKRAAVLIAGEQTGIEPDDIMEMFKYALFAREFEREEITIRDLKPKDDWNLPLVRIEVPPTDRTVTHLPFESQPEEYFPFTAPSIAEVLSERDALPGTAESWSAFNASPRGAGVLDDTLPDLARIPYTAFPAKGREILGGILLAKIKLRAWMVFKGYELPSFLRRAVPKKSVAKPAETHDDAGAEGLRGRPSKAAWGRVGELVRELHAANPEWKRSKLAFEALKIAATEYDEKDLPSSETVARQMKNILAAKS